MQNHCINEGGYCINTLLPPPPRPRRPPRRRTQRRRGMPRTKTRKGRRKVGPGAPVRSKELFEPTHEIMALIALRKLNLQTRMRSNPLWLHVWFFGQTHHLLPYFMCANNTGSGRCAVSPEPSLFAYAISTINSWLTRFVAHTSALGGFCKFILPYLPFWSCWRHQTGVCLQFWSFWHIIPQRLKV